MELTPAEWRRIRAKMDRDLECGDCVLWTGSTTGYQKHGNVKFRGKNWYAHRLMYAAFNGPIPHGKMVLHVCNPRIHKGRCVQPLHLKIGDQIENMKDRDWHGTTARKLGRQKAEEIRAKAAYKSQDQLAKEYGVSQAAVWKITSDKMYTHRT